MTLNDAIALLFRSQKTRWQVLKSDGHILDVSDANVNTIGQGNIIAPDTTGAKKISRILDAHARNPSNPEVVTINLSVDIPEPGIDATAFVIPQARITWGSGGSLNVADVDVIKGTQVTVSASVIQVDGIYFAPAGGNALTSVRINANLAYGARGNSSVAPGNTTTKTFDHATAGVFTVPNFAKDITVYAQIIAGGVPGGPGNVRIGFCPTDAGVAIADCTAVIDQNEGTAPNTVFPIAYPIPGWARRVIILNQDGANFESVTARFGLAL